MIFATFWPMRRLSTSFIVPGCMLLRQSIVSKRSSTGFQKKNFSDTPCRWRASFWNFS